MSEKRLKFLLSVTPMIIIISCVVAAFATHGWNIQRTIISDDPLRSIETMLPIGNERDIIKVKNLEYADNKIILEASVHSPFKVPLRIEKLSFDVNTGSSIHKIKLSEALEIPETGSADLKLESEPNALTSFPEGKDLTICSIQMRLNGIDMVINSSDYGGGC